MIEIIRKIYSKGKNTGAFYIFIGDILSKSLVFVGSVSLIRILSKNEYGLLTVADNIYNYIYLFSGFGVVNAVYRYLVIISKKEKQLAYYQFMLKSGLIFNTVYITFLIGGIFIFNFDILFDINYLGLIFIFITTCFQFITDFMIYTIRGRLLNRTYGLIIILSSLILIVSRFFGGLYFGTTGVIVFRGFAIIVFSLGLLVYVRSKLFGGVDIVDDLSRKEKKQIIVYSVLFMITNGLWMLFSLNDILLIDLLVDNSSLVAEYKVALLIPSNIVIISQSVGILVSPYFIMQENNRQWIMKSFKKMIILMLGIYLFAFLIFMILSEFIVITLFGNEYINTIKMMESLFLIYAISSVFRYLPANLIATMGKVKYNLIISFSGVVIQLILNYLLIRKYGTEGAIYSNFIITIILSIASTMGFYLLFRKEVNE